jgi:hypothetical protein
MCPADGRVGNGVTVVMVLADIPNGSPARDLGAEGVYVLLPLLQKSTAAARNADDSFPKYTVGSREAQFNCGISHTHFNLWHLSLGAPFPNINILCPSLRVDRFRRGC